METPELAYFAVAKQLLDRIAATQADAIHAASECVARSLISGGIWHIFGTGHSHMAGEEAYYRAGGLAPVNAILFPALMQHEGPVTSTQLERLPGLARIVFDKADVRAGDVLAVVSNSGRNAVPVEMARLARERGVRTIAITALAQSKAAPLGAGQSQKLYEVCDVVIDNCGNTGDAALEVRGTELWSAPTSSLANIAIIEQVVFHVACAFADQGIEPPLFKSANLPGGDAWNTKLIARYGDRVDFR